MQFQTVFQGLQWLGFLKEIFITFICGTDSPVNMASSTMQEPRSNTISHGISTSEVLDLPGSKQRKREMISLIGNVIFQCTIVFILISFQSFSHFLLKKLGYTTP